MRPINLSNWYRNLYDLEILLWSNILPQNKIWRPHIIKVNDILRQLLLCAECIKRACVIWTLFKELINTSQAKSSDNQWRGWLFTLPQGLLALTSKNKTRGPWGGVNKLFLIYIYIYNTKKFILFLTFIIITKVGFISKPFFSFFLSPTLGFYAANF